MKTTATFAFLAATLAVCFASTFTSVAQAAPVTFEWATVGNPGNTPDTEVMNDETTGYGGVDYTYRISKTEVTNAQYTEFLNAVADTDTNSLYNTSMDSTTWGGITRSGSSGSFTYAVKADSLGNGGVGGTDYTYGNKPVVFVSFLDAMRFTNWLENGQPTGAQGAGTTEDGVYNIGTGLDEVRNPSATYFIPSEDEWYKAAYYDPNSGVYNDYPTSTDLMPNNNHPLSDTGNSANFRDTGGVNVYTTGLLFYPMTDVGGYTTSESPYGTFDQGGNVTEWNETVVISLSLPYRGVRGGVWAGNLGSLAASVRSFGSPSSTENTNAGFRVAAASIIPEPSADFDDNGIVDGLDFLKWQRGETPDLGSAEELALWESQFGTTVPPLSALTVAIPEPSTLLLASLASLLICTRTQAAYPNIGQETLS
jgi:sulfatase modifying factor 1